MYIYIYTYPSIIPFLSLFHDINASHTGPPGSGPLPGSIGGVMESEDLKELQQTVLQRLNGLIQELHGSGRNEWRRKWQKWMKDYGFNQEKKGWKVEIQVGPTIFFGNWSKKKQLWIAEIGVGAIKYRGSDLKRFMQYKHIHIYQDQVWCHLT